MPAIRNSAKAIIVCNGKLLCNECADSTGVFYGLPGGGQEHGETLIDALKRECREEISADVEVHGLRFIREYLGIKHENPEFKEVHQVELMFLCSLWDGADPKPGAILDDAQTGIAWLPLEHLTDYRLYPLALRGILADCLDSNGQEIDRQSNSTRPVVYLGDIT